MTNQISVFWLLYSNDQKHNVKCAKHCAAPIAHMAASYLLWQEVSIEHTRICVGKAKIDFSSCPQTCPHPCPQTRPHPHPHTHTHPCPHTHAHAHTHTHAHTHMHMPTHTPTHAHAHTHMHMHTHAHTHTHTHTHMDTHTCTMHRDLPPPSYSD